MKLPLTLGVALVVMTAAASAQTEERVFIRHHGGHASMDANDDGWITREEAAAAADRLFDDLDSNDDGRLDDADRAGRHHVFAFRHGGGHAPHVLEGENCTRSEEGEGDERRLTVICRSESGEGPEWSEERRVERRVTVVRSGHEHDDEAVAPVPPVPPIPPMPAVPMMLMVFVNTEEFDRNGDGALSREEFRAQQLRYFDAGDGNGDGRVRAVRPPEPPEPPAPPAPPRRR